MADPTPLTIVTLSGPYPDDGDLMTWEVADDANGNTYLSTGRELVGMLNTDDTDPFDVVITSTPDALNRTGDLTISLAALEMKFIMLGTKGWRDATDRTVLLTAEDPAVSFIVARLAT